MVFFTPYSDKWFIWSNSRNFEISYEYFSLQCNRWTLTKEVNKKTRDKISLGLEPRVANFIRDPRTRIEHRVHEIEIADASVFRSAVSRIIKIYRKRSRAFEDNPTRKLSIGFSTTTRPLHFCRGERLRTRLLTPLTQISAAP